jgi:hypothetical protein
MGNVESSQLTVHARSAYTPRQRAKGKHSKHGRFIDPGGAAVRRLERLVSAHVDSRVWEHADEAELRRHTQQNNTMVPTVHIALGPQFDPLDSP